MRTQHDLGPAEAVAARAPRRLVMVVADDLIWGSRLRGAIERAGATAIVAADGRMVATAGPTAAAPAAAIVDLGLRRADGVVIVQALAEAGVPVIAVGQHDDLALRKRALAAGAARVYSYNKLFADGPSVIARWLRDLAPAAS